MSKKLILIATMALALAACSDKDNTASMEEPSMMDKTMDATKEMAADTADVVKDTTSNVIEGAGDMAADAKEATADKTGEMVDAAKEMVHDKAQSIADATADSAADAAADVTAAEAPAAGVISDVKKDADTYMGQ
ncbi:MAG: hypothetical protein WBO34_07520 [Gammaproteobacteria bacterium]